MLISLGVLDSNSFDFVQNCDVQPANLDLAAGPGFGCRARRKNRFGLFFVALSKGHRL
jgi:hypothetical protein